MSVERMELLKLQAEKQEELKEYLRRQDGEQWITTKTAKQLEEQLKEQQEELKEQIKDKTKNN